VNATSQEAGAVGAGPSVFTWWRCACSRDPIRRPAEGRRDKASVVDPVSPSARILARPGQARDPLWVMLAISLVYVLLADEDAHRARTGTIN